MFDKLVTSKIQKNLIQIFLVEENTDLSLFFEPQKIRKLESLGFSTQKNSLALIYENEILEVFFCLDNKDPLSSFSYLSSKLSKGNYVLNPLGFEIDYEKACLGWALAHYRFDTFKTLKKKADYPVLWVGDKADLSYAGVLFDSVSLVRDMINTPANAMMPSDIKNICKGFSKKFKAQLSTIEGKDLLKQNYPLIYAVGKASAQEPILIDLKWASKNPKLKICLVGKGVCFDSGGLDLKPSSNMLLMKKDMGGAAHVLGLAYAIMSLKLDIDLRVLIPAVENAVSGNAMRPLDVYPSRKGLSVEIGNTDAEGRLILADALYEGTSQNPDWIIDFATLTGAARVALGTSIPVLFSNQDKHAQDIVTLSFKEKDPIWQLPLFEGYKDSLKSSVADLSSTGSSSYAGAITAALFLQEFIPASQPWMHVDLMAYNLKSKPGFSEGGEAMALRTFLLWIKKLLGHTKHT